ncbi:MAG: hypothetical protein PHH73_03920 [Candidatus Rickettsiella isopodorum]|nr:hypothetical protein [Candidatus Rickettsiella isopodorum]
MGYALFVEDGIIDIADTLIRCPICGKTFDANKYDLRLHNAKKTYITIKCEGCKNRIGLTMDMHCDMVVFELENYETRIKRRKWYGH